MLDALIVCTRVNRVLRVKRVWIELNDFTL